MIHAKIVVALAVALALSPARAFAGLEALSAGADGAFARAAFSQPFPKLRASGGTLPITLVSTTLLPSMSWFRLSVLARVGGEQVGAAAATEVASLDLGALLNRQLKTQLKYSLGGKDVWVSGAFDRAQNAYVSILVDGPEAVFYNVKGLLDKEETVSAGTNKYTLRLSPNVVNQMKSEIVLENKDNEDDVVRITLKKMLDAVGAVGDMAKVGAQTYKVFYTDDIKNGRVDKTEKTITFILTEPNGEIHVFLIPAELVPLDKIAVFKMFNNGRVGLTQKDGKLKVYENP
jgi:hypothetical protein